LSVCLVTIAQKCLSHFIEITRFSHNLQRGNDVSRLCPRPWGGYTVLDVGMLIPAMPYKIKRLYIEPDKALSLQYHKGRHEIWHIETDAVTVTVDEDTRDYRRGEQAYIPLGANHRLRNNTDRTASVIEIQFGDFLSESDVIRIADEYNRMPPLPGLNETSRGFMWTYKY